MSSSSRIFVKKYDVFISFMGEDTRDNFTRDLDAALKQEDILTYIDYELERGDDIGPGLVKATKDSMMAIVVFSERYATSKWCLEELVQIMECERVRGQVVLPVFYKTNPIDVQKQTGSYKKPFEDYDRAAVDPKKVGRWRDALTESAKIPGWELSTHGDDGSQVIEIIVKHVLGKLHSMHCDYQEGLVGIEEQCRAVEGFSGKLGRVGLLGTWGTGKTTIAKVLFAKHSPQYDSVCFLKDIREESQIHGLTHVRDELLSELLKEQVTTSNFSGSTLSSRKVLIVLDDVDSSEQLEALFVGLGELGEGSSLIVTARDRHLLAGIVDEIHEFNPWDIEKSLVLFSLVAFKKSELEKGYEDLSERVVEYAAGLPFAIKILGSRFYSKKIKFWEYKLEKMKSRKKTLKEILDLFQVSYDGLSRQDQAIFLDIAFFFKDRNQDSVISILDACGFDAASGIQRLKDKALITISKTNTIQMLDFLQYMAFDIVENDETGPRRGTLLRDDALRSLDCSNEGTLQVVEGAVVDLCRKNRHRYELNAGIFNAPKLRIIKIYLSAPKKLSGGSIYSKRQEILSIGIPFKYDHLDERGSAELKYFEWTGYLSKSLPTNLCVKFLVEIRIPYSDVRKLWDGTQELVNLELLDLSECSLLWNLPDFSKAPKLKWVYLSGCNSMSDLHPSLLLVDTLVTLTLDRCFSLRRLMSEKHLRYLEELNVDDCSHLEEFSVSSDSIKRLDLSKTEIKKLYPSMGHLRKLVWLSLNGERLNRLPDELSRLTSLEELRISDCYLVDKEKLHVLCADLGSLKLLHLKNCSRLFALPDNISALSSLRELRLEGCSVEKLPTSIKFLEKLEILSLKCCRNLNFLPDELEGNVGALSLLRELILNETGVQKLPTSIKLLEKLEILSLEHCTKLEFLPELPLLIKELNAVGCISLVTVSTLKTFSVKMKGMEKHISFMNAMKLNECSLLQIMEDSVFAMMMAELCNVFVRSSVTVCFPGSGVPLSSGSGQGLLAYRSTGSTSITIEPHDGSLSHWLGTIYFVVLSSKPYRRSANIKCRIYGKDGECNTSVYGKNMLIPTSDHVFLWHGSSFKGAENFEFFATTGDSVDCIQIKECGIHLMCCSNSEFESLTREAEMEPENKSELQLPEHNYHTSVDFREEMW